jgi:hypothetical protein
LNNFKDELSKCGLSTNENIDAYTWDTSFIAQCSNGHSFSTKMKNIIRPGRKNLLNRGCSICAREKILADSKQSAVNNLHFEHKIIDSKSLAGNGKDNRNKLKYIIVCQNGHTYEKVTSEIADGCPTCNNGILVGQERVRIIFETYFSKDFPTARPNWLLNKSTGKFLELDGYCEELNVAFEFQGRQHDSNITGFYGRYEKQKERDKLKVQMCVEHNVKLIVIPQPKSYNPEYFVSDVLESCAKNGLELTVNKEQIMEKFKQISQNHETHMPFRDFVQSKGCTIKSKFFSTLYDDIDFLCADNHEFTMSGDMFRKKYGTVYNKKESKRTPVACPTCDELLNVVRKSVETSDCHNLAKTLNIELLSKEYKAQNSNLLWKCSHGKTKQTTYRLLKMKKDGNESGIRNSSMCALCDMQITNAIIPTEKSELEASWLMSSGNFNTTTAVEKNEPPIIKSENQDKQKIEEAFEICSKKLGNNLAKTAKNRREFDLLQSEFADLNNELDGLRKIMFPSTNKKLGPQNAI